VLGEINSIIVAIALVIKEYSKMFPIVKGVCMLGMRKPKI
jgi:hypothetical protein